MNTQSSENLAVYATSTDAIRLGDLIAALDTELEEGKRNHATLHEKVSHLVISTDDRHPANSVTMHTRFRLLDLRNHESRECILTYPTETRNEGCAVSVLSALGEAVLGQVPGVPFACNNGSKEPVYLVEEILGQPIDFEL